VLVLAYNVDNSPVHPRVRASKEVKQFRSGRFPRQDGTMLLVVVLRREKA
jgi:hypothetical protein